MKTVEWLDHVDREGFEWVAKRLSGNDTGLTGGHQAGLYLPKGFFERAFPDIVTTEVLNPKERFQIVTFPQVDLSLNEVTATYYNNRVAKNQRVSGTRNEFRLTRWEGASNPVQNPENTGALIVFAFQASKRAEIWVCSCPEEETDVESWLGESVEPGQILLSWQIETPEAKAAIQSPAFRDSIPPEWYAEFPTGAELFALIQCLVKSPSASTDPDQLLLNRRELEFKVFSYIENHHVTPLLKKGFPAVDDFVELANKVTNRRKARSGRSLELGLQAVFTELNISFEAQVRTEGKTSVDFLFPSLARYNQIEKTSVGCFMLAAKTCCKDRWRQITKEAKKLENRHLFTLQQGVSSAQIKEMSEAKVVLVVPQSNFRFFPKASRQKLLSLKQFTNLVRSPAG